MGYVPLFDTLTTGTLHGKWPDVGLWPVLLSMADRFGDIDKTPQYIASVTGLGLDDVLACIQRFCDPDPDSRSQTDDGRRLEPIDPDRKWGWHVVNHSDYREKARLLTRDSARTASGMDADRKRKAREHAARPPPSPEFPLSDGDGDGDGNPEKKRGARAPDVPRETFDPESIPGLNLAAWTDWRAYRKGVGKPLKPVSLTRAAKALAAYGGNQQAVVDQSIAAGWQGLFGLKAVNGAHKPGRRAKTTAELEAEEVSRAN